MSNATCSDVLCALDRAAVRSYTTVISFAILQFVIGLLILAHIQREEYLVRRGRSSATSLILPVYKWVVWAIILQCVLQAGTYFSFNPKYKFGSFENIKAQSAIFGVLELFLQFVVHGVGIFLAHSSAGSKALRQSVTLGLGIAICTTSVMVVGGLLRLDHLIKYLLAVDIFTFTFFLVLWLIPQTWRQRRPAFFPYAKLIMATRLVYVLIHIVFLAAAGKAMTTRFINATPWLMGIRGFIQAICQPLIIANAMFSDSRYWFGMMTGSGRMGDKQSVGAVVKRALHARKHENDADALSEPFMYHLPSQVEHDSARTMAVADGVKILNHALVQISETQILGVGGTSKVFRGKLHVANGGSVPVALKIVYTEILTAETVERLLVEARMLQALAHKNILEFHGVCLVPPAICLCLELCERGDLYTVYQGDWYKGLSGQKKLEMALDCAMAVAHIHSMQPPLIHDDIKSMNFMVTQEGRAKLGDLDFCFRQPAAKSSTKGRKASKVLEAPKPERPVGCLYWSAPEVITRKASSTMSDCYALGIVLWELVACGPPFTDIKYMHQEVLQKAVCEQGERPETSEANGFREGADFPPPHYIELLNDCWSADPESRPSASQIVERLQTMQRGAGQV